eukprot:Sspe_Gene.1921::Locus_640_Transcript_1_1_Confidence_1.000_Length_1626::g.1921::m.1921/K17285/SELENBP1; selenium-binding protein 1
MAACCKADSECVGGGYATPLDAMKAGVREKVLYIPAVLNRGLDGSDKPDYLATVDVDPESPKYSQVVHRLEMPVTGDELHHMGWNACSSCHGKPGVSTHNYLVIPGVLSGNVYFVDVKTDPREPRFHKTLTCKEITEKAGLALPHTSHCAPTEILMSFMGGPKEEGFPGAKNGFLSLDPKTLEINGRWERGEKKPSFGYDFWYQPRHNVMVSSEWGEPTCFASGFNPAHVGEGKYRPQAVRVGLERAQDHPGARLRGGVDPAGGAVPAQPGQGGGVRGVRAELRDGAVLQEGRRDVGHGQPGEDPVHPCRGVGAPGDACTHHRLCDLPGRPLHVRCMLAARRRATVRHHRPRERQAGGTGLHRGVDEAWRPGEADRRRGAARSPRGEGG